MSDPVLAACAELPNDNPGLHRGAVWFCADVTGPPVFERPPAAPSLRAVDADVSVDVATEPAPPVVEADAHDDAENDDIEIVEYLAFDDAIDESPAPPEVPLDESSPSIEDASSCADPFAMLVRVVEDVALGAGANDAARATLSCVLGRSRLDTSAADAEMHGTLRAQALAWQGILRSESEDFDAAGGAMLDEWCATLLAAVLGHAARADSFKRELRRRGVAAFGLVEQAA